MQHSHLRTLTLFSCWFLTANTLFHKTSLFWQLSGIFSFQLKRNVCITKNTWGSSTFQPSNLNTKNYIWFYFSIILYYEPKIFSVERMNPRYLNCVTSMIWSPTFTSKVEKLRLLLKLHYIYHVLLLLKQKSYASKTWLQVSNIPFNSCLDSPIKTTSSTKPIHLSPGYWMCFVSKSKNTV